MPIASCIGIAYGFLTFLGVSAWQEQTPEFGIDTKLVQVDIQVTEHRTGRMVTGLKAEDFQILDQEEPRQITLFEAENVPVDAVLVIDATGAVGRSRGRDFLDGLQSIVQELRPGDRLAVVAVGGKSVQLSVPLTDDEERVRKAITSALRERATMRHGSRPLLYAGIQQATVALGKADRSPRRRVVLVLTHNRAKYDKAKVNGAIDTLLESNATVVGMIIPLLSRQMGVQRKVGLINPLPRPEIISEQGPPPTDEILPETGVLDAIAEQTGGEVSRFKVGVEPEWTEIMERVRLRYLTGFHASPTSRVGEVRSIRVRLSPNAQRRCAECQVRARSRYTVR